MVIYLHKSITGVFELEKAHGKEYVIGKTIEDYDDSKWIELSDEQVEFYRKNPNAGAREIIEMKLQTYPEPPEQSLESYKESMMNQAKWTAINRLNALFPAWEIVVAAQVLDDKSLLEIQNQLTEVIVSIAKATDKKEVEKSIEGFKASIDKTDRKLIEN